jgi:hypothetical protein
MRPFPTAALLLFLACGSSPTPDAGMPLKDAGPPEPDAGEMPAFDAGPACGPKQLCTRTISGCKINLTQASCEAYYANKANCLDMAGYTYCNCYCVQESACADYFACGQLCFNDYCR